MRHSQINVLRALAARAALVAALCPALALSLTGVASAAFTRPFLHQIAKTTSPIIYGQEAADSGENIATDAAGDVWVGEQPHNVSEFDSAGGLLKTLEEVGTGHGLAIGYAIGDVYVAPLERIEVFDAAGSPLEQFGGPFIARSVAVDNSSEPSAGDIYVAITDGEPRIERFNSKGEPVDFADASLPYVHENKIIGTSIPGAERFVHVSEEPAYLAVDPHGDIFAVDPRLGPIRSAAVLEYSSSGQFLGDLAGEDTPGLGGSHEEGGWGGNLEGVAVDPASGHVLVSVSRTGGVPGYFHSQYVEGAVDEFEPSGHFLDQITTTSDGHRLDGAFAVALDSEGDLYVSEAGFNGATNQFERAVDAYAPAKFVPTITLAEPTRREPTNTTLNGSVDPDGRALTACEFEYVSAVTFVEHEPFANAAQSLAPAGATAGDFTLTFESATTAPIPYDASAAELGGALEALAPVGAGDVEVTGPAGGPYTVQFTGSLSHTKVPQLTADASALVPVGASVAVSTVTEGGDGGFHGAKNAPCEPAAGEIPADESVHSVHAEIANLEAGTVYRYRLAATASGALGARETSASLPFTTPAAPRIDATFVSGVSSEYADLHAQLDPLGTDTSYHFEYDAREYQKGEAPHGVSVPVPDASIGSGGATGSAEARVVQQIGPLAPDTTYHFRLVATGELEENGKTTFAPPAVPGPDETFTTLPAPTIGLPDNRAYELVTPLDKGGADDMFATAASSEPAPRTYTNQNTGFASPSGDQFLLAKTEAAFGAFPASGENAYVFSRSSAGWSHTPVASAPLGVQSLKIGTVDPTDFSRLAVNDQVGSPPSLAGVRSTSLVGPPGGPYTTLHADSPRHEELSEGLEATEIVGASDDLTHVVLETKSHTLCSGATSVDEGAPSLCEWEPLEVGGCTALATSYAEGSEGCLQLLDVRSDGRLLSRCGALLGEGEGTGDAHDAVSAAGAQFIFTAPDPYAQGGEGCWNGDTVDAPQLYMRSQASTIELSAAEEGAPEAAGHHPVYYVGAAEDASRVFFVTEAELTADDAGIHDPELYEWRSDGTVGAGGTCANTEGCRTRVSRGESGATAAGVYNVPAVSADGSAVYFTAVGRLTSGAPVTSGIQVDLYRYDTATGAVTYVATITTDDYPANSAVQWGPTQHERGLASNANWYTTPDGRYLLFASISELTGYSTAEAAPGDCPAVDGALLGGHCEEVYRYDSQTGQIACLSCDPSGAAPVSNALFERSGPEEERAAEPTRPISDDGSYAFFDTADPLVTQDTNGTLDVYEWHEGRVSLISSGTEAYPSFFLGSSADGANVFIGTHANLIPSLNTESQGNIYDARICTGAEPCIKPAAGVTAQCEGGACQTPQPAPIDQTPASLTFSGTGNLLAELPPPPRPKKTAAQIRAGRLAAALKICKRDRSKKERAACETQARKRYDPVKTARKPSDKRRAK
jgi:hypothetical protein